MLNIFDFRSDILKKLFVSEDVFFVGEFYISFVVFVLLKEFGMKGVYNIIGNDLY